MFDSLIQYYVDFISDEKKDEFILLQSSVAIEILGYLYIRFVKDGEVPIEKLSEEYKKYFWNLSSKYQTENKKRIEVVKAAYVIKSIKDISKTI